MKTLKAKILSLVLILFIGIFSSGCLFILLTGKAVFFGDAASIFFSGSSFVKRCSEQSEFFGSFFECTYSMDSQESFSNFGITGEGRILLLILDPIIIQAPAAATNFNGTYTGLGTGGDLDIQAGFTTIPVDINTNMTAEPGMQLVILDFPDPQPGLPGSFGFNFSYDLPPGPGPFEIKVMSAGKVPTEEGTFYPPIYPCETDFANIPVITVPESPTFQNIDLSAYVSLPGCNGLVYDYTGLTPITKGIPTLSEWGLIAMAGILGIVGFLVIRRRKVAA